MVREIEAAAPRYIVYVHNVFSWFKTTESSTLIFDWYRDYKKEYEVVGRSEMRSRTSVVHWGKPANRPPPVA